MKTTPKGLSLDMLVNLIIVDVVKYTKVVNVYVRFYYNAMVGIN